MERSRRKGETPGIVETQGGGSNRIRTQGWMSASQVRMHSGSAIASRHLYNQSVLSSWPWGVARMRSAAICLLLALIVCGSALVPSSAQDSVDDASGARLFLAKQELTKN